MTKNKYLSHRIVGNGYPIVFLHGFLESSTMWKYADLKPNKNLKYIFIDLPGHGTSKDYSANSLKEIALLVKSVLKLNEITKYALVGHSLGGYVGLELLDNEYAPEKLCLFSSHPFEDTPIRKQNRNRLIQLVENKKERFLEEAIPHLFYAPNAFRKEIEELINEAKEIDYEKIQDVSIAMRDRPDYRLISEKTTCEITYIGGKEDLLIDQKKLKRWIDKIGVKSLLINDTAHMAHIEKTTEFNLHLSNFLSTLN